MLLRPAISLCQKEDVIFLSLSDAKLLALEKNRDIQIQRYDIDFATGEIVKQKGKFDPILEFGGLYTRSETPTASTFIPSGSVDETILSLGGAVSGILSTGTFYKLFKFSLDRTETNSPIESLDPSVTTAVSFSIGQELLKNFGKDVNMTGVFVAKKDSDISKEEFIKTVSDVLFEVESDYWLLVAAHEDLKLAQKALELAEDLEKRNRIKVEVGILPQVAITQAKSEVAARKVDLIDAQNRLKRIEDRLKNRIRLDFNRKIKPVDKPTEEEPVVDSKGAIEEAYDNRAELKILRAQIEKNERLKKFYANQNLPRLAIEGTFSLSGLGGGDNPDRLIFPDVPVSIPDKFDEESDAFRNLVEGEFTSWSIMMTLSYPLFNRKAKGEYTKITAAFDRSIVELYRLKELIALEVRNSLREIRNSKRRVDAARISVELAREVLANEEEKFKAGLATTREVLESQRDLIDAESRLIRAIANLNISIARFERKKGTIIKDSGIILEEVLDFRDSDKP